MNNFRTYPLIALSFVTNHTISLHHNMYPLCACSQLDHLNIWPTHTKIFEYKMLVLGIIPW